MKVSRAQTARNRERIVSEAARLFRERGFNGISVAEVMRNAGLTHGGFYGHFKSKEHLCAEACRHAVSTMLKEWRERANAASDDPLGAIARPYLSAKHRNQIGMGCLMAALGPDAARQPESVRTVVTDCLGDVMAMLIDVAPGATSAKRRQKAISIFSEMVGALVVSRAVNEDRLSKEFLKVALSSVTAKSGRRPKSIGTRKPQHRGKSS